MQLPEWPLVPVEPEPDGSGDYIMGDHPTENPDGVTNSNYDYSPKTQEEKAELLNVEMVDVVDVPLNEGYPVGSGADSGLGDGYGRDPEWEFYQAHGFRRDVLIIVPQEYAGEDPEAGFYAAHGFRRDTYG